MSHIHVLWTFIIFSFLFYEGRKRSIAALETLFLYLHYNKTIEGHSISNSLCFSFFFSFAYLYFWKKLWLGLLSAKLFQINSAPMLFSVCRIRVSMKQVLGRLSIVWQLSVFCGPKSLGRQISNKQWIKERFLPHQHIWYLYKLLWKNSSSSTQMSHGHQAPSRFRLYQQS